MGFTQYWYRPVVLPKKNWEAFIEEINMLKDNLPEKGITANGGYTEPIEIAGWDGKSYDDPEAPIYNKEEDTIYFNGVGDLGHESVVIERVSKDEPRKDGRIFGFCKTNRKPYDTFVCLVLISFKRWFMDKVSISSDGDQEDWQPALDLYYKLTGSNSPNFSMLMRRPKGEKD
ncbi:MAG: hypothetical protein Q8O88_03605 [bacterium]|nr:hypothetical protein [bacterium]